MYMYSALPNDVVCVYLYGFDCEKEKITKHIIKMLIHRTNTNQHRHQHQHRQSNEKKTVQE